MTGNDKAGQLPRNTSSTPGRSDALQLVIKVVVYISLYFATAVLLGPLFDWTGGYMVGITATGLLASTATNVLCLRIYEQRGIAAIGLGSDRASLVNLALGLTGGAGAAIMILGGALLFRVARLQPDTANRANVGSFLFVSILLLFGSAGEELLFRGFGFQILLRGAGPWATIIPVGIIFAVMHGGNPNSGWLGLVNTAGFGILFGYAVLRSHDLWLPIGLHFGWNFTLPLFGVNVSGLKVRLTGLTMRWAAGSIWSGGEYGPEGSVLASIVLLALWVYLWKVPIRCQKTVILDGPNI